MEKDAFYVLGETRQAIVESLRSALEDQMPEMMFSYGLQERNGHGQFRWNFVITALRDKCKHLGWTNIFGVCKRGAWKTPVLFHTGSRYLITFMTETTFATVQRRKDKGKHYLCGGASFNQNVEPQYEQLELDLPPVACDSGMWIAQSREQLAQAVHTSVGEIQGHILVLFDVHGDKLLSVRAVRLTPDLAISTEEENWSGYILLPFVSDYKVELPANDDEDEDLVELL